jgi:hypothetical protein
MSPIVEGRGGGRRLSRATLRYLGIMCDPHFPLNSPWWEVLTADTIFFFVCGSGAAKINRRSMG